MKIKKEKQRGQVLLISMMLLAIIMTVIFSASFTNVTETKVTKLEEESQRALAAAEAAVEAMIAQSVDNVTGGTFSTFDGIENGSLAALSKLGENGIDTEKSQVYFDTTDVNTYIIPTILQNGEQYTLYLANPPDFTANAISSFVVYWGSKTGATPALEITVVNLNDFRPISRYIVDPGGLINKTITNSFVITNTGTNLDNGYLVEEDVATDEKEKVLFKYRTTVDLNANTQDVGGTHQYAFVRVLFANSRLAFETDDPETIQLPAQGKTAVADVVTKGGVNKAVKFFRTYQQLPAEFFITTF